MAELLIEIDLAVNYDVALPFSAVSKVFEDIYILWLLNHSFSSDTQRSKVPIDISEGFTCTNSWNEVPRGSFFLKKVFIRCMQFFKESELPCTCNHLLFVLVWGRPINYRNIKMESAQLMVHNGGVALCFCLLCTFAFWCEKSIKMTSKTHHRHSEEVFSFSFMCLRELPNH